MSIVDDTFGSANNNQRLPPINAQTPIHSFRTFSEAGGDKIPVEIEDQKISVWTEQHEKVVAWDDGKQCMWDDQEQKILVCDERDEKELLTWEKEEERKRKRICGTKKGISISGTIVLLVLLATSLSIGFGVGLRRHPTSSSNNTTSEYLIGGALDEKYYSTQGAFNGTGIALASQAYIGGSENTIVLFYQHYDGTIRWLRQNDGTWSGGGVAEIVASDAKNNTPISVVSYTLNNIFEWHLFYIGTDNKLLERRSSNETVIWTDGPLSNNSLYAYDSDQVGLQACGSRNVYNDSDNNIPVNSSTEAYGIHLWYTSTATTVSQLDWQTTATTWSAQHTFTAINPHSGIGCFSPTSDTSTTTSTTDYVMLTTNSSTLEIWGKETNTSDPTQWTLLTPSGVPEIGSLHPSTSLSYANFLYTQALTGIVSAYKISFRGLSVEVEGQVAIEEYPGIGGTHIAGTQSDHGDGRFGIRLFIRGVVRGLRICIRRMKLWGWGVGWWGRCLLLDLADVGGWCEECGGMVSL